MPLPRIPLLTHLRYVVERLLLAGMLYRLLVLAAVVALLAAAAGCLVWWLRPLPDHGLADTMWWAFLQLTDPGYLGDEGDPVRRGIATVLVAVGLAIFVGALVATMTQWLQQRIRLLERGTTPVPWRGHLLIVGWTSRTPALLRELLQGRERVRRFLLGLHVHRLRLVILAEEADAEMGETLHRELGALRHRASIVIRSGDPLEPGHLARGGYRHAGAVILPADRRARDEADQDARAIAVAATMAAAIGADGHRPALVAEMQDPARAALLAASYHGPVVDFAADALLPSCLAGCVRQPGLPGFLDDVFDPGKASGIYLRLQHACAGASVAEVARRFPRGVLLGLLSRVDGAWRPELCPADDRVVTAEDGLIFLAAAFGDVNTEAPSERGASSDPSTATEPVPPTDADRPQCVLLAGWNRRSAALARILLTHTDIQRPLLSLSVQPAADRRAALDAAGVDPAACVLVAADSAHPASWDRLPQRPDVVVIQGSDRYQDEHDVDAAALAVLAAARSVLGRSAAGVRYLLEWQSDHRRAVLAGADDVETVSSARLMAHMLAQAALRPELEAVYEHLFAAGCFQIRLRPLPAGLAVSGRVTAAELRAGHARQGERILALVRDSGHDVRLAIGGTPLPVRPDDRIAVLVPAG